MTTHRTDLTVPVPLVAGEPFRVGQHPRAWRLVERGVRLELRQLARGPLTFTREFARLPQHKPGQRISVDGWGEFIIERNRHGFRLRPVGLANDDQTETIDRIKDRHESLDIEPGPFRVDEHGGRAFLLTAYDPYKRMVLLPDGKTLQRDVDTAPYFEAVGR